MAQPRLEADQAEYGKIVELVGEVMQDENSRLPYVPTFYPTMQRETEIELISTQLPKADAARGEEFCLSACEKQGTDCMGTAAWTQPSAGSSRTTPSDWGTGCSTACTSPTSTPTWSPSRRSDLITDNR